MKKQKSSINSNKNYRSEIKIIPIKMDYCVLIFNALNFFLVVRLHRVSVPNFIFLKFKPIKFDLECVKFTAKIVWIQIFTTFLT